MGCGSVGDLSAMQRTNPPARAHLNASTDVSLIPRRVLIASALLSDAGAPSGCNITESPGPSRICAELEKLLEIRSHVQPWVRNRRAYDGTSVIVSGVAGIPPPRFETIEGLALPGF